MILKVLNLYAGIGGNRLLWEDVDVVAVEWDERIASIYQDFFPNDEVIITDAHQFLLENFDDYDFIWSSPPCPTHSVIRRYSLNLKSGRIKPVYPNMELYEEILFLDSYFKGKWCVENVVSYYDPLIKPQKIGRHYFWSNFIIREKTTEPGSHMGTIYTLQKRKKFDLSKYDGIDKIKILRNCVEPELGRLILESARGRTQSRLLDFKRPRLNMEANLK